MPDLLPGASPPACCPDLSWLMAPWLHGPMAGPVDLDPSLPGHYLLWEVMGPRALALPSPSFLTLPHTPAPLPVSPLHPPLVLPARATPQKGCYGSSWLLQSVGDARFPFS